MQSLQSSDLTSRGGSSPGMLNSHTSPAFISCCLNGADVVCTTIGQEFSDWIYSPSLISHLSPILPLWQRACTLINHSILFTVRTRTLLCPACCLLLWQRKLSARHRSRPQHCCMGPAPSCSQPQHCFAMLEVQITPS